MICRLQVFFLLFWLSTFCYSPLFAQNQQPLSYHCQNKALIEVLKDLENEYDLVFAYDVSAIEKYQITSSFKEQNLQTAIKLLLFSIPVDFEFVGEKYVVLKENPEKSHLLTIKGKVIDAKSQEILPFATITIKDLPKGTMADENGFFSYTEHFRLNQEICVSHIGYTSYSVPISKFPTDSCINIALKPGNNLVKEVVVKEFTVDMLNLGSSTNKISFIPEKIPTLPGWGEPDILRSLQLIPGISASDKSGANLNIRGGYPDQTLILWDEIPIYHTGHFFGLYSFINPYVISQVDIYRGNFDAEYGDRVSGVIDMKGKPKNPDKFSGGVGFNFINSHVFIETPMMKKKSSLLIAGRRSYTDIFNSNTYQNLYKNVFQKGRIISDLDDFNESNEYIYIYPDFHYADANLKWAWQINTKNYISISAYTGNDNFNYKFKRDSSSKQTDKLKINNTGASFQYRRLWNRKSETHFTAVQSKFANDYFYSEQYIDTLNPSHGYYEFKNRFEDYTAKLEQSYSVNSDHNLRLGAEITNNILRFSYLSKSHDDGTETWNDKSYGRTMSFYFIYDCQFIETINVNLSLRHDRFKNSPESKGKSFNYMDKSWQPRIITSWNPSRSKFTYKFSAGLYQQYIFEIPSIYHELGVRENDWVMVDDYFEPLSAIQWSLGINYKNKQFYTEIEYYDKYIRNLSTNKLDLEDNFENPYIQDGLSKNRGVDILIKNRWGRYSTWLSYSFALSEQKYDSLNNGMFFPTEQDERHKFNYTHMLKLKHWDISLSWHFSSGKPYTKPIGITSVLSADNGTEHVPEYENLYNERLPSYHRLDFAVNYKFYKNDVMGKIGFSVYNLYDRTNIMDIDYSVREVINNESGNTVKLDTFTRKMLGFTPNLFLQFEW